MLVLTRKLGEVLRIGQGITVRIIDIKGKHVKIGIEAPAELLIYREEIYEKIQAENRLSSTLSVGEFGEIKEAFKNK
ncbi:MAG TPA: carbon storage regulator [Nitrospirae bacterium]|nr:carbon storage regulator [bacterium BMS3Abin06]HDH13242.1 carbon storage regulator [Nitrospirota bacterium]HDZ01790.1 carbon storage regulator [Nitrospirota bacterium]